MLLVFFHHHKTNTKETLMNSWWTSLVVTLWAQTLCPVCVSVPLCVCLCVQACLLLSLESTYPPAHQLSLDMLKVSNTHTHSITERVIQTSSFNSVCCQRLSTANDEIVEVLLSKQQVLGALRFIRSVGTSMFNLSSEIQTHGLYILTVTRCRSELVSC